MFVFKLIKWFSKKKPEDTKETKKCNGCLRRIPVDSDKCPHCRGV